MNKAALIVAVVMLTGICVARAQRPLAEVSADSVELIAEAVPGRPAVEPGEKRRVLVFYRCEGFYHGSIPVGVKLFEIMGKKTGAFETEISDKMDAFEPENLKRFDAVLFNNTTRLSFKDEKYRESLMAFVKSGKGIIGIHAATDCFYNWDEASAMIGGLFDGHPWGAGGTWAIRNDEPGHPLNKCFAGKGFKIKDEIYQIKGPYSRDTHRVLLSLDMSDEATGKRQGGRADKDYAVSWIKKHGDGRIFYCSLGHNNEVFWNPAVVRHYLDGIQYALGDYKVDDAPSHRE